MPYSEDSNLIIGCYVVEVIARSLEQQSANMRDGRRPIKTSNLWSSRENLEGFVQLIEE